MLRSLQLADFRNYHDRQIEFEPVTIFVGPNGIGKTNILEAIGFLALARSFRAKQEKEVIAWSNDVARIVGQTDESLIEVAVSLDPKIKKLIKINGVARRSIELLGHLSVVLFLPESIGLVAGPPQQRRQFLDLLLIQEDRRYAYHLLQLQKVLRQRNRLLRQIDEGLAELDQLTFWDQSLVEHGSYLVAARVRVLRYFNQTLSQHYQTMSRQKGKFSLRYQAASISQSGEEASRYQSMADYPTEPADWAKLLAHSLITYQKREIAAGTSLYGPQRDDFAFVLNDRPLAEFGSRGEFRSAVLALKAAEADFLLNKRANQDDQPALLFLLDDVYSELDVDRRAQLAKLVGDHQVVITTTDLAYLDPSFQKKAKVIKLG